MDWVPTRTAYDNTQFDWVVSQDDYDCENYRTRVLATFSYSGLSTDPVSQSQDDNPNWHAIAPDSFDERFLKRICHQ